MDGKDAAAQGGRASAGQARPAPILPVGIAGGFESFPRTAKLPTLSPLFMPATRGALAASVGEPLDTERLLKLPREEFLQVVFDAIQAAQHRAERLKRKWG